jgi:hypothetical protein
MSGRFSWFGKSRGGSFDDHTTPNTAGGGGMSNWKKIETAPKDKTSVLVAVARDSGEWIVGEAYFDPEAYDGSWWWANEADGDYYDDPISERGNPPSFWMPLPAPPAQPQTGE